MGKDVTKFHSLQSFDYHTCPTTIVQPSASIHAHFWFQLKTAIQVLIFCHISMLATTKITIYRLTPLPAQNP